MSSDMERIRERIRQALAFIPAADRDIWLRMGMAIKPELGDGGYELWDEWSQQDESYHRKAARNLWRSIKANGKVTVGTLFHSAKENGWRDDGTLRIPTPEEIAERQRGVAERAAKDEAEIARERAQTAKKATAIWNVANEAKPDHPYLLLKHVFSVETLREIHADEAAARFCRVI